MKQNKSRLRETETKGMFAKREGNEEIGEKGEEEHSQ